MNGKELECPACGLGDANIVSNGNNKELLVCPKAEDCAWVGCPHYKPHEKECFCDNNTCDNDGNHKEGVACIICLKDWDN